MKKFIFLLTVGILGSIFTVDAQTYVNGYFKKMAHMCRDTIVVIVIKQITITIVR